jgi:hypothetical protein
MLLAEFDDCVTVIEDIAKHAVSQLSAEVSKAADLVVEHPYELLMALAAKHGLNPNSMSARDLINALSSQCGPSRLIDTARSQLDQYTNRLFRANANWSLILPLRQEYGEPAYGGDPAKDPALALVNSWPFKELFSSRNKWWMNASQGDRQHPCVVYPALCQLDTHSREIALQKQARDVAEAAARKRQRVADSAFPSADEVMARIRDCVAVLAKHSRVRQSNAVEALRHREQCRRLKRFLDQVKPIAASIRGDDCVRMYVAAQPIDAVQSIIVPWRQWATNKVRAFVAACQPPACVEKLETAVTTLSDGITRTHDELQRTRDSGPSVRDMRSNWNRYYTAYVTRDGTTSLQKVCRAWVAVVQAMDADYSQQIDASSWEAESVVVAEEIKRCTDILDSEPHFRDDAASAAGDDAAGDASADAEADEEAKDAEAQTRQRSVVTGAAGPVTCQTVAEDWNVACLRLSIELELKQAKRRLLESIVAFVKETPADRPLTTDQLLEFLDGLIARERATTVTVDETRRVFATLNESIAKTIRATAKRGWITVLDNIHDTATVYMQPRELAPVPEVPQPFCDETIAGYPTTDAHVRSFQETVLAAVGIESKTAETVRPILTSLKRAPFRSIWHAFVRVVQVSADNSVEPPAVLELPRSADDALSVVSSSQHIAEDL